MKDGGTAIIFSYFPMICKHLAKLPAITNDPSMDKVYEMADLASDSVEMASAIGCMWVHDEEDGMAPVLIMDNARELYTDLTMWAEGDHAKWFTLDWCKNEERYALAIVPKFEQTVKRFKLRLLIEREEIIQDAKYSVLFQPIRFFSAKPSQMFSDWRPGPATKIGMIDMSDVDTDKMAISTEPLWIGPIEIVPNSEWIQQYLEERDKIA